MNKIWKGKSKKSVTQNVNVEAQCTMPIETGKSKRTRIILPLIVLLALICVIAIIYIIGAGLGHSSEIAEIKGDKNAQTEQILAATDVADTTVGTNVKAKFTASTGEIHIWSTTSSPGILKTLSFQTFLYKCSSNMDVLQKCTITFDNIVKAPKDASTLFWEKTPEGYRQIRNVTSINNIEFLDTTETTTVEAMFYNLNLLKELDLSNWNTGNFTNIEDVFMYCRSLETLNISGWSLAKIKNDTNISTNSDKLMDIYLPRLYNVNVYLSGQWYNVTDTNDNTKYSGYVGGDIVRSSTHFRKLVDYTITYNLNGGTATGNPTTYNGLTPDFVLNIPTKPGYKFKGWTGSNGTTPQVGVAISPREKTRGNLTYTANWEADVANYQVRHWKQNINGNANIHDANNYTLAETEAKTAQIGTSVTPPVKNNYTGFNIPPVQTKAVASNGTTIIDYYYTRKTFTVTLNKGTGIDSLVGANTYVYGANVTIDANVSEGYIWLDWTGTQKTTTKRFNFTMPATNVTYTANAKPNTATKYVVNHWQQKLDGNAGTHDSNNYTLISTQNATGTTGASVTPPVKSTTDYQGFTPPPTQTKTIAGNGGTVINYYYTRNTYTITLNKDIGIDTITGVGSYLYGANVNINATLLDGYSWKNWTGTLENTAQNYTFAMPAENIINTAHATVNQYRITYDLNGGQETQNPEQYTVETESFTLAQPTREGYTFLGWTGTNGTTAEPLVTISKGSTGDMHYRANWTANQGTEYTVKHWKQNVDGKAEAQNEYNYTIAESKIFTGTTDTKVTPETKNYEGFTSPQTQEVTILGDGSLEVNYYYTRNSYEVTLNKGKGVAAVLGAGTYLYEEEVTINAIILAGYDWVKWQGERETRDIKVTFQMPAENLEFTTLTMANPNTKYTINHWKQKIDGIQDQYNENNYEIADTDILTGETDSKVSPETKEYEGFIAPDAEGISVPITGEGTLVIDYYYKRNSYEVKLNKGTGIENIKVTGNITGQGKESYLYEEQVTIEAEVKPGYTWKNWIVGEQTEENENTVSTQTHTFTIGAEGVEYTAEATPNQDTPYTVKHWQENLPEETTNNERNTNPDDVGAGLGSNQEVEHNGKKYTLVNTENKTGTTDEKVTPQTKEYAGFTAPEAQEVTILGNGKLEVNYYYTRNLDTPYIVEHWQENLPEETTNNEQDTNPDTVGAISNRPTEENSDNNPDVIQTDYNGKKYTLVDTENKTGTTGAIITPETKEYPGFTSPEKQTVEILGNGSLVVKYYYTRNLDTPYVVKHYKQNLENTKEIISSHGIIHGREGEEVANKNNYTLIETENLTGTTGATITPETKNYEGFTAPKTKTVEILGDGSLEVNYYYTRNSYEIVLNKGKGIESVTGAGTYQYGENVIIEATTLPGYTWSKWEGTRESTKQHDNFAMIAENIENTAIATANTNTPYIVRHWKQNINGNPEIKDEQNYTSANTYEYTGTTDEKVTPQTMNYAGFTAPEAQEVTILGDGSLEVNYYYTRNTDTPYTIKHWKENLPEETTNNEQDTNPDDVGAGTDSVQEVEHNGKKYTLIETEELKGTTEATITPNTKQYEGFISPEKESLIISPEGNGILNYYYARRTDLTYVVKHIDKDTGKIITKRTVRNQIFETEIDATEEIMEIDEYELESVNPETLKIGTGENEINIYYVKKQGKVIIHHYIYNEKTQEYTNIKLIEDEEITGKIGESYTSKPSQNIPENYISIEQTPENSKGEITGEPIEVSYYYKLKTPEIESDVGGEIIEGDVEKDEEGNWIIKAGQEIKYKVKYSTKIKNYKGKVTIEITAKLPEGTQIDINKCDLAGGTYNRETNSIKWEKEIEKINTFIQTGEDDKNNNPDVQITHTTELIAQLKIEKEITIVYAQDYILEDISLDVTGTTTLYYPEGHPGTEDETLKQEETDENGKIITHHYIYNEKEDKYTTIKLAEDEEIIKKVGKTYTTYKSSKIPENYICINEKPQGYTGTTTKQTIEVNYYYKLKTPTIESETGGEIIGGEIEKDEEGNWIIKAGEEIKYKVKYTTKIKDYKGKALIEIKAKLPEGTQIDINKCDLAGGTYDEETHTITWTKEIQDINTFAHTENTKPDTVGAPFGGIPETRDTTVPDNNGAYENGTYVNGTYIHSIEKEITIVYKEDYVIEDANLKVTGKTTLYYPEGHPGEGDDTLTEDEAQEKGKIIVHHYIYDEKENKYTTGKLIEDEEIIGKIGDNYTTKPSDKKPENYVCIEEKPEGHTGKIEKETKEITYYYKLKMPTIESETSGEIISGGEKDEQGNWKVKAGEQIKYKIKYQTKISQYKGKALIEIKAELPKRTKIDINKSNIAGGTYDEETHTITWTKEIQDINTFAHTENTKPDTVGAPFGGIPETRDTTVPDNNGAYENGAYIDNIEKEITIVYKEDYILEDLDLNVTGKTTLYYPEGYPEKENEILIEEKAQEKGKVIIHHYIYDREEDKTTTQKLVEDEKIEGKVGDNYTTKPSESIPENFRVVEEKTEDQTGKIKKGTKEINYYYELIKENTEGTGKGEIIEGIEKDEEGNWVITKGKEVKYKITYEAKIENYKGKAKIIVIAKLPKGTQIELNKCDLAGGTYEKETHTITWTKEIENINTFQNGIFIDKTEKEITIVYKEDYILKDANLEVEGNIITYYPDDYLDKGGQETPKEETPEEKNGIIIVKYLDIDTNQEIGENYSHEITGKLGDAYETEEKQIPYYTLVKATENTKGQITEKAQTVIYYYKKQNFNIGIEKTINSIILNGENLKIRNNQTAKIELKKSEISKTELIVKYNIKVTNQGEIEGTAKILERIPEGYEIAYLPEYWKINRDGTLETEIDLKVGESRNIDIALRWENKESNLGAKTNIAEIGKTENQANYKDTNEKDNVSEATIVISIKTGEVVSSIIIMIIILSFGICTYIMIILTHKKEEKIKDIKFLNK